MLLMIWDTYIQTCLKRVPLKQRNSGSFKTGDLLKRLIHMILSMCIALCETIMVPADVRKD